MIRCLNLFSEPKTNTAFKFNIKHKYPAEEGQAKKECDNIVKQCAKFLKLNRNRLSASKCSNGKFHSLLLHICSN